ncbi:MAG: HPr family phosphocarrier protein [Clostridia bacterium]|nr:HPr family phosphocarrier protein [Clostridia bacterium]
MKSFKVMLSSIVDVKNFVNLVNEFSFDVDMVSGRYVVDAKSLMGIFSLELSKPIVMRVYSEETEAFEKALKEFIVD